jgi:catechol 2,3-dioxygenase
VSVPGGWGQVPVDTGKEINPLRDASDHWFECIAPQRRIGAGQFISLLCGKPECRRGVMSELGHVVFYVRNLETSLRFYREAIGLACSGTIFNGRGALLTGGRTHHELLLIEVGEAEGPVTGKRIGLYHVGWKVGDTLDRLREARDRILGLGYALGGQSDHTVSQSLYLCDPDGNEVEVFVDNPAFDWRTDNTWMEAPVRPLIL